MIASTIGIAPLALLVTGFGTQAMPMMIVGGLTAAMVAGGMS